MATKLPGITTLVQVGGKKNHRIRG